MRYKLFLYLTVFLAVVSCASVRRHSSTDDSQLAEEPLLASKELPADGVSAIPQAASRLSFEVNLLRECIAAQEDKSENLVVSPLSAATALSMVRSSSQGQTRIDIDSVLGGADFGVKVPLADSSVTFMSANSFWLKQGIPVKEDFLKELRSTYSADIFTRDFGDRSLPREINRWCSDHTAGRIDNVIGRVSPEMTMCLINALYFKGLWNYPFDSSVTEDLVFHGTAGDKKVPMMHSRRKLPYLWTPKGEMLSLPFRGGRFCMLFFLPAKGVSPDEIIKDIDGQVLRNAVNDLSSNTRVNLSLPKFKLESSSLLNAPIIKLGGEIIFSSKADFGAMTTAPVSVSEVLQKCFIEVDESGSEAAAVTVVAYGLTSVPVQDIQLSFNRPFLFGIYDTENDDLAFAGIIRNI